MSDFEFRGVDNLVYAEVTGDDNEQDGGYVTGTVKPLSAVATIAKSTANASEAHYYDNKALIVVNSEGADTFTLTVTPLDLATYADVLGKDFDQTTGMLMDSERTPKYFALGYRTKGTDGHYRYVWRLKGSFGIPDETNETENDGTDATNMELTFTGISTTHVFTKNNKASKAIVVDERIGNADLSDFFDSVQTPDTISVEV